MSDGVTTSPSVAWQPTSLPKRRPTRTPTVDSHIDTDFCSPCTLHPADLKNDPGEFELEQRAGEVFTAHENAVEHSMNDLLLKTSANAMQDVLHCHLGDFSIGDVRMGM